MDMETRDRLETLVHRLECVGNMLYIIHVVVDQNVFDAKAFAPALYGTYEYLAIQTEGLRELCGAAEGGTDRAAIPRQE